MTTFQMCSALVLVGLGCSLKGGQPSDAGQSDAAEPVAELVRLTVPHLDGGATDEWAYLARPADGAPAPIVVIAHGQGVEHIVNCWPREVPHDFTVNESAALALALARQGYVAVAVSYRNAGQGAPSGESARLRDLDHRDARTVLAAAELARSRGHGTAEVAYVGFSNGTFPALWSALPRPELADLQAALQVKTVVLAGHTVNAVANIGRTSAFFSATDKTSRQQALVLGALSALTTVATALELDEVDASTFTPTTAPGAALAELLTDDGVQALKSIAFTRADTRVAGCSALADKPVICDGTCLANTMAASADPGAITKYLRAPVIDACTFWNAETAPDPGLDTPNPLLRVARRISPPYSAQGSLLTPRALLLFSSNDNVTNAHGARAREALASKLRALGATVAVPEGLGRDASGPCQHGDYGKELRACGYQHLLAELRSAFGR